MPIITNIPSGGAGLNFDAIAVASVSTLPLTAKENTIAVITSIPISGIVVDSIQPTTILIGKLWIKTHATGSVRVNIGKKQTITLPLVTVYQFDTSWQMKVAYIWISGAWKRLATVLYAHGVDNTALTGGWVRWASGGSVTVYPNYVGETAVAYGAAFGTNNAVDLTGYSTFFGMVTSNVPSNIQHYMAVRSDKAVASNTNLIAKSSQIIVTNLNTPVPFSIDITAINVARYLGMNTVHTSSAVFEGRIFEAYLI